MRASGPSGSLVLVNLRHKTIYWVYLYNQQAMIGSMHILNAALHGQPYKLDWCRHNLLAMCTRPCITTEMIMKVLNTIYVPQPKNFMDTCEWCTSVSSYVSLSVCHTFSSPEPKAHWWANSIPVTPSSVGPSSVNIFKHFLLCNY